jgi:hypothetical protein
MHRQTKLDESDFQWLHSAAVNASGSNHAVALAWKDCMIKLGIRELRRPFLQSIPGTLTQWHNAAFTAARF